MAIDISRRATVLGAFALAALSAPALAQDARAPKGPIEIVVPASAGSTPDVLMRRMAKIFADEKIIEIPMVIVNRPGGAWSVGMRWLLDRPGDENTVLSLAEPVFSTPIVQGGPTAYDQFTPLAVFMQTQLVVLAQPNHEAKTLKDIVELARAKPRQVKMAGSSPGSTDAQVAGLIEKAGNVKITFIPHDGGGAAQATFLGGNTDIITVTLDEGLPLIQAGKAKALAVLTTARRPEAALKDIPTAREQGVDVVWGQIFGLVGAPKLDPAVVKWWDDKITKLVATKGWQDALAAGFLGSDFIHGAELKAYLDTVHKSRLEILKQLGMVKG